jgi:DNA-binding LacI/PurR family transcriptional regulator
MSNGGPARPPTLDEVAARAGVGRGTVSRVINGSSQVSDTTRTAVLKAVDELGYVPNRAARSLVTRATDTIALVVSESQERVFGEPFFGQIVRGISGALAGTRRQLVLTMTQSGESGVDRLNLESYLSRQHMDGVLLLSLHGDDPLQEQLASRGVPAVLGGRPAGPVKLHYVDADNAGGAAEAVAHLARAGRRRIATVTGPQDMAAGVERLHGYRVALGTAGLGYDPVLVATGDFSEASGFEAGKALLESAPDVDAVFAASDQMAIGVMAALAAAGRRVPDDVAVIGFDDVPISRHVTPSLTTVHQPIQEMGAAMVHLLTDLIDGRPVADVVLDTHLVVRESA